MIVDIVLSIRCYKVVQIPCLRTTSHVSRQILPSITCSHKVGIRPNDQELQPRDNVVDRREIHTIQQERARARRRPHAKLARHHALGAAQIKHDIIRHKRLVEDEVLLPLQAREAQAREVAHGVDGERLARLRGLQALGVGERARVAPRRQERAERAVAPALVVEAARRAVVGAHALGVGRQRRAGRVALVKLARGQRRALDIVRDPRHAVQDHCKSAGVALYIRHAEAGVIFWAPLLLAAWGLCLRRAGPSPPPSVQVRTAVVSICIDNSCTALCVSRPTAYFCTIESWK